MACVRLQSKCNLGAISNYMLNYSLDILSNSAKFSKPSILAKSVHAPIVKLCLHDHIILNNNLLSVYSKFGELGDAHKLFDEFTQRDVVGWTCIVSACARRGEHQQAIELFRWMLVDDSTDVVPNEFTYSSVLRCAASLKLLDFGAGIHASVVKHGHESNEFVGNVLLDFYSKCGELDGTLRIFGLVECKDVVLWTSMISVFVDVGDYAAAMQFYVSMVASEIAPNNFTFAKLMSACGCLCDLRGGKMLHGQLILRGIELNVVLKTTIVDMYSKCQRIVDARKVFGQTKESDVKLWTTMIVGCNEAELYQDAINVFQEMENVGVQPNSFTYSAVLNACSSAPFPEFGKQIHCLVIKVGLEHEVSVGNTLVNFYNKCSMEIKDSLHSFESISFPNVISWTTLIAGLSLHGFERDALVAFADMMAAGVQPNSSTLTTILKGFNSSEALAYARMFHAYVVKSKIYSSDLVVGNSFVDLYARYGRPENARVVAYNMMPYRDVLTYTSLAKAYNQVGLHRRVLDLVGEMFVEDVTMDGFSLSCFLAAAAGLTTIEPGKQLHCFSIKSGLVSWTSVSNGLVDLYGKCGSIEEAHRIFMATETPNLVSWNGLIWGLASNGHISKALSAFEDMRLARVAPDDITFLLVLYACSHGGLMDAGIDYFNTMKDLYGVVPKMEHYVCLVDMLGRAGRLEEAACTIESMPFQPDSLIHKTLLAACKHHKNLVLGECIARKALEIDASDPSIYVLLSDIYYDAGKLEWCEQIRGMMRERAMRKSPGQSWMNLQR